MRVLALFSVAMLFGCVAPRDEQSARDRDALADGDAPNDATADAGFADVTDDAGPADAGSTAEDPGNESLDAGPNDDVASDALTAERDALLQSTGVDRCAAWSALDEDERAELVLITDVLGARTALPDGSSALSHVTRLYAVRGRQQEGCVRCCGDREYNRLYVQLDDVLQTALRDDALPGFRPSQDPGGPHEPFTLSRESEVGLPRAQIHLFAADTDAVPLGRTGVEDVLDPRVVEIDVDFNVIHESAPLCTYNGTLGFDRYDDEWRDVGAAEPVERDYLPTGCE